MITNACYYSKHCNIDEWLQGKYTISTQQIEMIHPFPVHKTQIKLVLTKDKLNVAMPLPNWPYIAQLMPGIEVICIKLFMLNSTEHGIYHATQCKNANKAFATRIHKVWAYMKTH